MTFDSSAVLYIASLAMSAAAIVLFLWLMREPKGGRGGGEPTEPKRDARR